MQVDLFFAPGLAVGGQCAPYYDFGCIRAEVVYQPTQPGDLLIVKVDTVGGMKELRINESSSSFVGYVVVDENSE